MKKLIILVFCVLLGRAYAVQFEGGINLLGQGFSIGENLTDNIVMKINYNNVDFNQGLENNNLSMQGNNLGAILSYKLIDNLFIEGGVYYNNFGISEHYDENEAFNRIISLHHKLDVTIEPISYYAGINYTVPINKQWYTNLTVGLLTVNGTKYRSVRANGNINLHEKPEAINLNIPMVGLSIGYRF
jgi:hypothetical protein